MISASDAGPMSPNSSQIPIAEDDGDERGSQLVLSDEDSQEPSVLSLRAPARPSSAFCSPYPSASLSCSSSVTYSICGESMRVGQRKTSPSSTMSRSIMVATPVDRMKILI